MFLKMLDILRIVLASIAFYFGYQIGFSEGYNPEAQIHFMTPLLIFAIAGISGIEGIFFAKKSAKLKGFETDGNYQRQNAIALLSYSTIAFVVYFCDWGIRAELTILFAFLFFFLFSAINHGAQAIKHKNYKWQNINRPFITFALFAGLFYPILMALKGLS